MTKECVHHFIVPPPSGGITVEATCRKCNATRKMSNITSNTYWSREESRYNGRGVGKHAENSLIESVIPELQRKKVQRQTTIRKKSDLSS